MLALASTAALILCLAASLTSADVIEAAPGDGTITAAAAKAKDGDTIRLAAGAYTDSVELSQGVALEGAGPDKTTLTAKGYAAVNCKGERARVAGITIKPADQTVRGVNTSTPVRVERCRFQGIKEGVAMMAAPLSDVVACDFIDCDIGVRAIGGACPTVWGCFFKGGRMGVFAMDGMPYIRNCVFAETETGLKLFMSDNPEQPIVRNNLFLRCKSAGIELASKKPSVWGPSIRNNLFERTGAAIIADEPALAATSHCLYHASSAPAFRDKNARELKAPAASVAETDAGVSLDGQELKLQHPELVDAKGIRASDQPKDAVAQIGPETPWRHSGTTGPADLPPIRYAKPLFIANAVAEEYQYLSVLRCQMGSQSVSSEDGKMVDILNCTKVNQPLQLKFDLSRFYDEMSLTH